MAEEVAESAQLTTRRHLCPRLWFVFGSLIPGVVARGISWNVLLYAVLSLTLVRMVPVALALVRSGLGTREVLFLGWIGPRGLASILVGLIAIEDLHAHGLTRGRRLRRRGDRGDRRPERAATRVDGRGHRGPVASRPDRPLTRPGPSQASPESRKPST